MNCCIYVVRRGDYLREQTKAIKEILKSKYPAEKFKVHYAETHNYIDHSDRIIVTCDRDIDIDKVINLLNKYTYGIQVYKQGSMATTGGNIEPKIYSVDMQSYTDADIMEFIEIRSSGKSFELMRKMAKISR